MLGKLINYKILIGGSLPKSLLEQILPEAPNNVRHPYRPIESKLSKKLESIEQEDILLDTAKKHSLNNSTAQSATSNDIVEAQ
jgi:hypothetical protein